MSGLRTLTKVTFEPHNNKYSKVTGEFDDGSAEVVYLDNVSTRVFLYEAMVKGSMTAGVQVW